ncbi:coenzyme F420-0:L-glutamate ligase [Ruminococcaceae bacterium OttesenSCG-928-N02]|nr:coenzyme F420-0:L-glutamate ligase [Ruminococcaceae bacterium OttesenSCG-928-N02]
MSRMIGTVSRGVRAPIIRPGDDLVDISVSCVLAAAEEGNFTPQDRDIICLTEAIVAKAQGNYADVSAISDDIRSKFGGETIGLVFPILSRNRFAVCLRGIAGGAKKIVLQLSYPADELGNHLFSLDALDEKGINPHTDVLTLAQYRELFGENKHTFTGVDYVDYYYNLIIESGAEAQIIFANDPRAILKYTKNVLTCDVHTRARSKRLLKAAGAELVLGLDEILTAPVNGSGYNETYGLLGSNKATETRVKLFPRACQPLVNDIQKAFFAKTGKMPEVMVFGDGAFKDPVGKIWELADPVVSPAFTKGLEGTPNEIKLKYVADNDFAGLSGEALQNAVAEYIKNKDSNLVGNMLSEGTTPRPLVDLIGSLCDLTTGSGDKGTPIVYIQGYFDNYTSV